MSESARLQRRARVPSDVDSAAPSSESAGADVTQALQRTLGNRVVGAALAGKGGEMGPYVTGALGEERRGVAAMRRGEGGESGVTLPGGGGRPLEPWVRARMEAVLGRDLSSVRVHTDGAASRTAADLNAQAFATGSHIFFSDGAYQPGSPQGDELLGHELVHVVQHQEGRVPQDGGVSHPSDPLERQAYGAERQIASDLAEVDAAMGLWTVPSPSAPGLPATGPGFVATGTPILRRSGRARLPSGPGAALVEEAWSAVTSGGPSRAAPDGLAQVERWREQSSNVLEARGQAHTLTTEQGGATARQDVRAERHDSDGPALEEMGSHARSQDVHVPAPEVPSPPAPQPAPQAPAPVPVPITAPVAARVLRQGEGEPVAAEVVPEEAPSEVPLEETPEETPAETSEEPGAEVDPQLEETQEPQPVPVEEQPETESATEPLPAEEGVTEVAQLEQPEPAPAEDERIADLRDQIASLDVQIADLQRWIEQAESKLAAVQERMGRLGSSDGSLAETQGELQAELAGLQTERATLDTEAQLLQLQAQQEGEEPQTAPTGEQRQNRALTRSSEREQKRISSKRLGLSRDLERAEDEQRRLEAEIAQLQEDLAEAQEERDALQAELDGLLAAQGGGGQAGAGGQSLADGYPQLSPAGRAAMDAVEAAFQAQLAALQTAHTEAKAALEQELDAQVAEMETRAEQMRAQVTEEVQARREAVQGEVEADETELLVQEDGLASDAETTTLEEQLALLEEARAQAAQIRAQAETEATQTLQTGQQEAQAMRDAAASEASSLEAQASQADNTAAAAESAAASQSGAQNGTDPGALRAQASSLRAQAAAARAQGEANAQTRLAQAEADAADIRARGEEEATALLDGAASAADLLESSLQGTLTELQTSADAAIEAADGDLEAIEAALVAWEEEAYAAIDAQLVVAQDAMARAREAALVQLDDALVQQEAALRTELGEFADGIAAADAAGEEALAALQEQQIAALAAAGQQAQASLDQVRASSVTLAGLAVGVGLQDLDRRQQAAGSYQGLSTAGDTVGQAIVEAPTQSPLLDEVMQLDAVDLVLSGVSGADALALTSGEHPLESWADVDTLVEQGVIDAATRDQLYAAGAERYLAARSDGGALALSIATYDSEEEFDELGIDEERAAIREGLGDVEAADAQPAAELIELDNPSPAELEAILAAGDFGSVFLSGHAQEGQIVLPGPDGERVAVPREEIARILGEEQTLTGVFLNVCGTAGEGDELLAAALTEAGVASLSWTGNVAATEQAVPMAEVVARAFAQTGDMETAFHVAVAYYDQVLAPAVHDPRAAPQGTVPQGVPPMPMATGRLRIGDDEQQGDTMMADFYGQQMVAALGEQVDLTGLDTLGDGDEVYRGDYVEEASGWYLWGADAPDVTLDFAAWQAELAAGGELDPALLEGLDLQGAQRSALIASTLYRVQLADPEAAARVQAQLEEIFGPEAMEAGLGMLTSWNERLNQVMDTAPGADATMVTGLAYASVLDDLARVQAEAEAAVAAGDTQRAAALMGEVQALQLMAQQFGGGQGAANTFLLGASTGSADPALATFALVEVTTTLQLELDAMGPLATDPEAQLRLAPYLLQLAQISLVLDPQNEQALALQNMAQQLVAVLDETTLSPEVRRERITALYGDQSAAAMLQGLLGQASGLAAQVTGSEALALQAPREVATQVELETVLADPRQVTPERYDQLLEQLGTLPPSATTFALLERLAALHPEAGDFEGDFLGAWVNHFLVDNADPRYVAGWLGQLEASGRDSSFILGNALQLGLDADLQQLAPATLTAWDGLIDEFADGPVDPARFRAQFEARLTGEGATLEATAFLAQLASLEPAQRNALLAELAYWEGGMEMLVTALGADGLSALEAEALSYVASETVHADRIEAAIGAGALQERMPAWTEVQSWMSADPAALTAQQRGMLQHLTDLGVTDAPTFELLQSLRAHGGTLALGEDRPQIVADVQGALAQLRAGELVDPAQIAALQHDLQSIASLGGSAGVLAVLGVALPQGEDFEQALLDTLFDLPPEAQQQVASMLADTPYGAPLQEAAQRSALAASPPGPDGAQRFLDLVGTDPDDLRDFLARLPPEQFADWMAALAPLEEQLGDLELAAQDAMYFGHWERQERLGRTTGHWGQVPEIRDFTGPDALTDVGHFGQNGFTAYERAYLLWLGSRNGAGAVYYEAIGELALETGLLDLQDVALGVMTWRDHATDDYREDLDVPADLAAITQALAQGRLVGTPLGESFPEDMGYLVPDLSATLQAAAAGQIDPELLLTQLELLQVLTNDLSLHSLWAQALDTAQLPEGFRLESLMGSLDAEQRERFVLALQGVSAGSHGDLGAAAQRQQEVMALLSGDIAAGAQTIAAMGEDSLPQVITLVQAIPPEQLDAWLDALAATAGPGYVQQLLAATAARELAATGAPAISPPETFDEASTQAFAAQVSEHPAALAQALMVVPPELTGTFLAGLGMEPRALLDALSADGTLSVTDVALLQRISAGTEQSAAVSATVDAVLQEAVASRDPLAVADLVALRAHQEGGERWEAVQGWLALQQGQYDLERLGALQDAMVSGNLETLQDPLDRAVARLLLDPYGAMAQAGLPALGRRLVAQGGLLSAMPPEARASLQRSMADQLALSLTWWQDEDGRAPTDLLLDQLEMVRALYGPVALDALLQRAFAHSSLVGVTDLSHLWADLDATGRERLRLVTTGTMASARIDLQRQLEHMGQAPPADPEAAAAMFRELGLSDEDLATFLQGLPPQLVPQWLDVIAAADPGAEGRALALAALRTQDAGPMLSGVEMFVQGDHRDMEGLILRVRNVAPEEGALWLAACRVSLTPDEYSQLLAALPDHAAWASAGAGTSRFLFELAWREGDEAARAQLADPHSAAATSTDPGLQDAWRTRVITSAAERGDAAAISTIVGALPPEQWGAWLEMLSSSEDLALMPQIARQLVRDQASDPAAFAALLAQTGAEGEMAFALQEAFASEVLGDLSTERAAAMAELRGLVSGDLTSAQALSERLAALVARAGPGAVDLLLGPLVAELGLVGASDLSDLMTAVSPEVWNALVGPLGDTLARTSVGRAIDEQVALGQLGMRPPAGMGELAQLDQLIQTDGDLAAFVQGIPPAALPAWLEALEQWRPGAADQALQLVLARQVQASGTSLPPGFDLGDYISDPARLLSDLGLSLQTGTPSAALVAFLQRSEDPDLQGQLSIWVEQALTQIESGESGDAALLASATPALAVYAEALARDAVAEGSLVELAALVRRVPQSARQALLQAVGTVYPDLDLMVLGRIDAEDRGAPIEEPRFVTSSAPASAPAFEQRDLSALDDLTGGSELWSGLSYYTSDMTAADGSSVMTPFGSVLGVYPFFDDYTGRVPLVAVDGYMGGFGAERDQFARPWSRSDAGWTVDASFFGEDMGLREGSEGWEPDPDSLAWLAQLPQPGEEGYADAVFYLEQQLGMDPTWMLLMVEDLQGIGFLQDGADASQMVSVYSEFVASYEGEGEPPGFLQFWSQTLANVMNTQPTPESIGRLSPVEQEIFLRGLATQLRGPGLHGGDVLWSGAGAPDVGAYYGNEVYDSEGNYIYAQPGDIFELLPLLEASGVSIELQHEMMNEVLLGQGPEGLLAFATCYGIEGEDGPSAEAAFQALVERLGPQWAAGALASPELPESSRAFLARHLLPLLEGSSEPDALVMQGLAYQALVETGGTEALGEVMGVEPQAAFAQLADQLGTDWAAGVMLSPQVDPDSQALMAVELLDRLPVVPTDPEQALVREAALLALATAAAKGSAQAQDHLQAIIRQTAPAGGAAVEQLRVLLLAVDWTEDGWREISSDAALLYAFDAEGRYDQAQHDRMRSVFDQTANVFGGERSSGMFRLMAMEQLLAHRDEPVEDIVERLQARFGDVEDTEDMATQLMEATASDWAQGRGMDSRTVTWDPGQDQEMRRFLAWSIQTGGASADWSGLDSPDLAVSSQAVDAAMEQLRGMNIPAGAEVELSVMPVQWIAEGGGASATLPLVQVHVGRQTWYLDSQGGRYASTEEFMQHNSLPDGLVSIPELHGDGELGVEHHRNDRQTWVDSALMVGGLIAGGLLLASGLGAPIGAALLVGATLTATASSAWFLSRSVQAIDDRAHRNQELRPWEDTEALLLWLDFGASVLGLAGGLGGLAGMISPALTQVRGFATLTQLAGRGGDMADWLALGIQAHQLHQMSDQMAPSQRWRAQQDLFMMSLLMGVMSGADMASERFLSSNIARSRLNTATPEMLDQIAVQMGRNPNLVPPGERHLFSAALEAGVVQLGPDGYTTDLRALEIYQAHGGDVDGAYERQQMDSADYGYYTTSRLRSRASSNGSSPAEWVAAMGGATQAGPLTRLENGEITMAWLRSHPLYGGFVPQGGGYGGEFDAAMALVGANPHAREVLTTMGRIAETERLVRTLHPDWSPAEVDSYLDHYLEQFGPSFVDPAAWGGANGSSGLLGAMTDGRVQVSVGPDGRAIYTLGSVDPEADLSALVASGQIADAQLLVHDLLDGGMAPDALVQSLMVDGQLSETSAALLLRVTEDSERGPLVQQAVYDQVSLQSIEGWAVEQGVELGSLSSSDPELRALYEGMLDRYEAAGGDLDALSVADQAMLHRLGSSDGRLSYEEFSLWAIYEVGQGRTAEQAFLEIEQELLDLREDLSSYPLHDPTLTRDQLLALAPDAETRAGIERYLELCAVASDYEAWGRQQPLQPQPGPHLSTPPPDFDRSAPLPQDTAALAHERLAAGDVTFEQLADWSSRYPDGLDPEQRSVVELAWQQDVATAGALDVLVRYDVGQGVSVEQAYAEALAAARGNHAQVELSLRQDLAAWRSRYGGLSDQGPDAVQGLWEAYAALVVTSGDAVGRPERRGDTILLPEIAVEAAAMGVAPDRFTTYTIVATHTDPSLLPQGTPPNSEDGLALAFSWFGTGNTRVDTNATNQPYISDRQFLRSPSPEQRLIDNARWTPGTPLTILGHGYSGGIGWGKTALSAQEFADVLRANGVTPENTPRINLIACNTGYEGADGVSFARELARIMGIPVLAPVGYVNVGENPNGTSQVFVTDEAGNNTTVIAPDKAWVQYGPDGQIVPTTGDSAFGMRGTSTGYDNDGVIQGAFDFQPDGRTPEGFIAVERGSPEWETVQLALENYDPDQQRDALIGSVQDGSLDWLRLIQVRSLDVASGGAFVDENAIRAWLADPSRQGGLGLDDLLWIARPDPSLVSGVYMSDFTDGPLGADFDVHMLSEWGHIMDYGQHLQAELESSYPGLWQTLSSGGELTDPAQVQVVLDILHGHVAPRDTLSVQGRETAAWGNVYDLVVSQYGDAGSQVIDAALGSYGVRQGASRAHTWSTHPDPYSTTYDPIAAGYQYELEREYRVSLDHDAWRRDLLESAGMQPEDWQRWAETGELPPDFETADLVFLYALEGGEQALGDIASQYDGVLQFHNTDHTLEVMSRAQRVMEAMAAGGMEISEHDFALLYIAASFHDVDQSTRAWVGGQLNRNPGQLPPSEAPNELSSAERALQWMEQVNADAGTEVFSAQDMQTVQQAIMATVPGYDPVRGVVVQPNLANFQDNPVAMALALGDVNKVLMDDPGEMRRDAIGFVTEEFEAFATASGPEDLTPQDWAALVGRLEGGQLWWLDARARQIPYDLALLPEGARQEVAALFGYPPGADPVTYGPPDTALAEQYTRSLAAQFRELQQAGDYQAMWQLLGMDSSVRITEGPALEYLAGATDISFERAWRSLAEQGPGLNGGSLLLDLALTAEGGGLDPVVFLQHVPPEHLDAWVRALGTTGMDGASVLGDVWLASGTADPQLALLLSETDPQRRMAALSQMDLDAVVEQVAQGGYEPLAVEALALIAQDTPFYSQLVSQLGERLVVEGIADGTLDAATVAGWLRQDPATLTPAQRAATTMLREHGALSERSVLLLATARTDGALDMSSPAVLELVMQPLSAALPTEGWDPDMVLDVLEDVRGAGGPQAVDMVLDLLEAQGILLGVGDLTRGMQDPAAQVRLDRLLFDTRRGAVGPVGDSMVSLPEDSPYRPLIEGATTGGTLSALPGQSAPGQMAADQPGLGSVAFDISDTASPLVRADPLAAQRIAALPDPVSLDDVFATSFRVHLPDPNTPAGASFWSSLQGMDPQLAFDSLVAHEMGHLQHYRDYLQLRDPLLYEQLLQGTATAQDAARVAVYIREAQGLPTWHSEAAAWTYAQGYLDPESLAMAADALDGYGVPHSGGVPGEEQADLEILAQWAEIHRLMSTDPTAAADYLDQIASQDPARAGTLLVGALRSEGLRVARSEPTPFTAALLSQVDVATLIGGAELGVIDGTTIQLLMVANARSGRSSQALEQGVAAYLGRLAPADFRTFSMTFGAMRDLGIAPDLATRQAYIDALGGPESAVERMWQQIAREPPEVAAWAIQVYRDLVAGTDAAAVFAARDLTPPTGDAAVAQASAAPPDLRARYEQLLGSNALPPGPLDAPEDSPLESWLVDGQEALIRGIPRALAAPFRWFGADQARPEWDGNQVLDWSSWGQHTRRGFDSQQGGLPTDWELQTFTSGQFVDIDGGLLGGEVTLDDVFADPTAHLGLLQGAVSEALQTQYTWGSSGTLVNPLQYVASGQPDQPRVFVVDLRGVRPEDPATWPTIPEGVDVIVTLRDESSPATPWDVLDTGERNPAQFIDLTQTVQEDGSTGYQITARSDHRALDGVPLLPELALINEALGTTQRPPTEGELWGMLGRMDAESGETTRSAVWDYAQIDEYRLSLSQALGYPEDAPLDLQTFLWLWVYDLNAANATAPGEQPEAGGMNLLRFDRDPTVRLNLMGGAPSDGTALTLRQITEMALSGDPAQLEAARQYIQQMQANWAEKGPVTPPTQVAEDMRPLPQLAQWFLQTLGFSPALSGGMEQMSGQYMFSYIPTTLPVSFFQDPHFPGGWGGDPSVRDWGASTVHGPALDPIQSSGTTVSIVQVMDPETGELCPVIVTRSKASDSAWLQVDAPSAYYGPHGPELTGRGGLPFSALLAPGTRAFQRAQVYDQIRMDPGQGPADLVDALEVGLMAEGADPSVEFTAVLASLPQDPSYRRDFFLELFARGADPTQLIGALASDAQGLTDIEIDLLAFSVLDTQHAEPMIASVGDMVLGQALQAEVAPSTILGWLAAEPSSLSPAQEAAAYTLRARGIHTEGALALYVSAYDPATGLDLQHPLTRTLVLEPLQVELRADEPRSEVILALLDDTRAAGGPQAVEAVLDAMIYDGSTTVSELGAWRQQLRERVVGTRYEEWLFGSQS
jgi:uncharacterized membrane protein YphA (DoxX/SURF4 family)